ncbi:MAG: hypothetical protein KKF56_02540 [Nanoarchaeota archaeon]|nr:hypothetical protein [Nanoarchaeota archaeon]
MPKKDRIAAFFDGLLTTGDLVGTARGYSSGDDRFMGYVADKYGMTRANDFPGNFRDLDPISRTWDERVVKGVGDFVGICFYPIIQLIGAERANRALHIRCVAKAAEIQLGIKCRARGWAQFKI